MALRIANFMDSALEALDRKGNLSHALALYNPRGAAETVVHFTPHRGDARYAAEFAARRVEIFPFFNDRARGRAWMIFAVPAAFFRVLAKIRRERLTLIRGRLPYFGSLLGCLAGRLLGVPSVVSLGGDNRIPQAREGRYYFGSRWISYGMEQAVLRLCDAIIAPNVFTRDYVATLLGEKRARRKTVVIPWILERAIGGERQTMPVDLAGLGLDPGLPIILIVGHLNHYKYSLEMFEVAAEVLTARPGSAQFVFCGDGPLRSQGERRLSGIAGAHLLGWQPNETVLGLMQRAALVLVPISGFVLLEAASLARPVVASHVEWHGEMITEGETGWLVQAEAVPAWAARICWILDHPAQARAAGERLKVVFQTDYSPDVALQREAELYARLLGSGPGRQRHVHAGVLV